MVVMLPVTPSPALAMHGTRLNILFNTITYQIAEVIPELRPYVARIIEAEPSILDRSIEEQTR